LWSGDYYYAIGYSEKHQKVSTFRIDRMVKVTLTDLPVVPRPKDFRIERYYKSVFGMFDSGETQSVTLLCDNCTMKSILDQFGTRVKTEVIDEGHFTVSVDVSVSQVFFGWIVGFNGKIRIISPRDVLNEYSATLKALSEKAVI
jgi:predicted DNA-binding transcriptional regulator YafY